MSSTVAEETTEAGTLPAPSEQPQPRPVAAPAPYDPWLALAALVILGGISGVAYYLGFVRPYLLELYFARPLLDLAKINGHTAPAANAWGLTWIVLFACYYLAFRLCPPSDRLSRLYNRTALAIICGWAAFFCINLIMMYPVGAADLFDQIFRARLLSEYNLNPFTTLPVNIEGDPFRPYVAWVGDPSPYGPLWELPAGLTSLLAGDSLWRNLIAFKLLVTVAYGISVALTYAILRVVRPDWALRGTLFFAWNPLVLFEIPGNGHNDAIVVAFLLAAIFAFVTARRLALLPALMAGALAKFVPVLLVPIAAAALWRDRTPSTRTASVEVGSLPVRRRPLTPLEAFSNIAIGAAIALGLAVVLYAPFWQGTQSIGALGRQTLFTASIPRVLLDVMVVNLGMAQGTAQTLVRNGAFLFIGIVALALALRLFLSDNADTPAARRALVRRTLSSFYEVIFFYLAFATLWFQPWYLLWLVALTAPVARFANANRTVLFCIGGVANYFVWDFIWLWNRTTARDTQVMAAIVVYTLPLFYTLYVWLKPLWERAAPAHDSTDTQPAPMRV